MGVAEQLLAVQCTYGITALQLCLGSYVDVGPDQAAAV